MYSSTILNIILCLFLLDLSDFALVLRVKFFLDFRFSLLTFLLSKLDRVNPHDIGVPISACCWCGRISIGRGNGEAKPVSSLNHSTVFGMLQTAECTISHIFLFCLQNYHQDWSFSGSFVASTGLTHYYLLSTSKRRHSTSCPTTRSSNLSRSQRLVLASPGPFSVKLRTLR